MRGLFKGLLAGCGAAGLTIALTAAPASAQSATPTSASGVSGLSTSVCPTPTPNSTPDGGTPGQPATIIPASATSPAAATAAMVTPSQGTASQLAFTGVDIGAVVGAAGVLVGGGIILVRMGRRREDLDAG